MRAEEVVLRLGRFVETTLPPVSHEVRNQNRRRGREFRQNSAKSGARAMAPSSLTISQITPAGYTSARTARSTAASVWPRRSRTPPGGREAERRVRAPEVLRLAARFSRGPDCLRPVVGRNAGRDATALQIDRDGERRPAKGGVFRRHRAQLQLIEPVARHSDTDQPPTVHSHEVTASGVNFAAAIVEVRLHFRVFIVDHDDNATCSTR